MRNNVYGFVHSLLTCDTKGISVCSTERVLISSPESKLLLPHGDEAIPAELCPWSPSLKQCTAATEFTESFSFPVSERQTGVADLPKHAEGFVRGCTVVYEVALYAHARCLNPDCRWLGGCAR